jgi:hypothetical protein
VVGFAADLNSDECSFESDQCTFVVDVVTASGDAFFGALLRAVGSVNIDLMSAFRSFSKNAHLVGKDFDKSPGYRKPEPTVADPISKLADFQLREKRRVSGQDAEISLGARNLQFVDMLMNERAFRSDEREIDGPCCHGLSRCEFFSVFEHFLDSSLHVESLLRNIIVLAFDDFPETFDRVRDFHVFAFEAGELLCHEERL